MIDWEIFFWLVVATVTVRFYISQKEKFNFFTISNRKKDDFKNKYFPYFLYTADFVMCCSISVLIVKAALSISGV